MEFNLKGKTESSRRSSFWKYIPGFSRKNKEQNIESEHDITLISANKLYSSFRFPRIKEHFKVSKVRKESASEVKSENTDDIHNNAGLLFLTNDNQLRWRVHENDVKNKHVQFAPSPMNKYHTYNDNLSHNKENMHSPCTFDSSIMKTKKKKTDKKNQNITNRNILSERNINSPSTDLRAFTLPRTSTKSTLSQSHDVMLSYFDVSAINDTSNNEMSLSQQFPGKTHSANNNCTTLQTFEDDNLGIPYVPRIKHSLNKSSEITALGSNNNDNSIPKSYSADYVKGSEIMEIYLPPTQLMKRETVLKSLQSRQDKLKPELFKAVSTRSMVHSNDFTSEDACTLSNKPSDKSLKMKQLKIGNLSLQNVSRKDCHHLADNNKIPERPNNFSRFQALNCSKTVYGEQTGKNTVNNRELVAASIHQFHSFQGEKCIYPTCDKSQKTHCIREKYRWNSMSSNYHHPRSFTRHSLNYKVKKYEGMSSAADDECSLNCSCLCCIEDITSISGETQSNTNNRAHKSKLFFPAQKVLSKVPEAIPEAAYRKSEWFNCDDSMCKSPQAQSHVIDDIVKIKSFDDELEPSPQNHVLDNAVQIKSFEEEPIYANSEVLIEDNYIITRDTSVESGEPHDENLHSAAESDGSTQTLKEDCDALPHKVKYPKTLNESCILALQETLSSLFNASDSKLSFSVSSFDNDSIIDKSNTIIVQIKNPKNLIKKTAYMSQKAECKQECDLQSLPLPEYQQTSPTNYSIKKETFEELNNKDTIPLEANRETSLSGWSNISSSSEASSVIQASSTNSPLKFSKELISPKKSKFKAKDVLSGKAKLKLNIYHNYGMVTVHVVKAVKLSSVRTVKLNPYVKVTLFPDDSKRVHWRTNVVHEETNPEFDQKFSFEIVPEDAKKRLIFSIWHRDKDKKRSEFLGCMSFGVYHVMESNQRLSGWYRFLKEIVGTKKHLAVRQKRNSKALVCQEAES